MSKNKHEAKFTNTEAKAIMPKLNLETLERLKSLC